MDLADRAQIEQEREYARLFARHSTAARQRDDYDTDKPYDCIDCGVCIPRERVNLGHCVRCVDCQTDIEKKQRR